MAATARFPLTVARTTVVNLLVRCCWCSLLSGMTCRLRMASLAPSRNRKNSRYSMTAMAIRKPKVFCPQLTARLRSEEHTSELQSRFDLVCRLLLEKKKLLIRYHSFADVQA